MTTPRRRLWTRKALLALAVRLALIAWGDHQDATSEVKYTDVDYHVVMDAARCLVAPHEQFCSHAAGALAPGTLGDPYARDTYRYTPLLALIVSVAALVHRHAAKVVFALCDILVADRLERIAQGGQLAVDVVWLFNPIVCNISTRGSPESIVGLLVLQTLLLAEQRRTYACAGAFGLAVHFKLYPVIYAPALLQHLSPLQRGLSWRHLAFGATSLAAFMLLNACMYSLWGWPFIEHTYLYHLRRLDHRHNFSPYFYSMYLGSSPGALAPVSHWLRSPLASFVPQAAVVGAAGLKYGADNLSYACFVATVAFVTLNKVCTSQYFLWYLWLLPVAMPRMQTSAKVAAVLAAMWVAGQAMWLGQAYRLEMLGEARYRETWLASVVFMVLNGAVLGALVK